MAKNRARDARRVAKSIRTHEKTMDAYSNATGWARISGAAWDNAWGDKADITKSNPEDLFPDAKKGNRATGNIITPKDTNPRQKIERKAAMADASEKSRLGHTLGKGHVAITEGKKK